MLPLAPVFSKREVNMLVGYARVSTSDQSLRLQKDALLKAGCEEIYTDVASGIKTARPGLHMTLSHLRKGDTLVVGSVAVK